MSARLAAAEAKLDQLWAEAADGLADFEDDELICLAGIFKSRAGKHAKKKTGSPSWRIRWPAWRSITPAS